VPEVGGDVMKAEVQKKYSICVEIEQERAEQLINDINFLEANSRGARLDAHYSIFEFQKMLIAKITEINDMEMRE